jgi:hypothetical protein
VAERNSGEKWFIWQSLALELLDYRPLKMQ